MASSPTGQSYGSEGNLSQDAASLYKGVMGLFDEGDFAGQILQDAVAKFESADYRGAESDALHALGTQQQDINDAEKQDKWKLALDRLASTYGDEGESEMAESIFLRMLAWREGIQQQRTGQSSLASGLFEKSMEYNGIDDATWFLQSLKPDDGHAIKDVILLLALGERVAAKAAVATWTLALRGKHRVQITENGGLELLTSALIQYPENAELAAAGCGAIRLLCQGHALAAQNRRVLVTQLDGHLILINAMRIHQSDVEVQRECCGALGAMAMDNIPGAHAIVAKDGILMCLDAVVSCPDQAVGNAACKTLATLCGRSYISAESDNFGMEGDDVAEEAMQASLASLLPRECSQGLSFCARALEERMSQSNRIVLQSLLWAAMIFLDDSSLRHQALHISSLIVNCMTTFPGHEQIQVPACGILWRLTVGHMSRDEAVQRVAMAGAINPICQAMRDLPTNMDLQQLAIGALRNIAFGNDTNKTSIVKAGGIQAVITGMKRYPKDAKLQEQAIGALTSLCDTAGRAAICARLNGIQAVITALKRHAAVGHIAELGCIILCMFCDDQQLKHMIVQLGALQIAKALSRTENSEAQQWGCELLRDLSDS